ncbi:beta-glucuronosyltransferase GlcAT14A [Senna tora]|uniref:Beta-glucuronosyltransferase GlcAT14A n=1 Tax=Senna tora TaxID=362788 RepID=A0A834X478_9FABA|nr:beta-glucuronosyltransferase GlcAT14A [Senna tora]
MQNPSSPSDSAPSPPSFPSSIFNFRDPKSILFVILAFSLISLLLILSLLSSSSSPSHPTPDPFLFPAHRMVFDETAPSDPSIAYLISGSRGDVGRLLRLLFATYHPRNHYLLHLDPSAPQSDRVRLALSVQSNPVFRAAQNVDVMGKADFAYFKGSSPVSFTLHGASILLRLSVKWNWFISLSVDDYPLVTQDDLLHILSFLPKDVNFVNHSSYIGWKESRKLRPIIVDPGLYLSEGTEMFFATQKREYPQAYRLFTGSSFSILSRRFLEFCILGEDNLPRILLMYFANTPKSLSSYFPTVLCNSGRFSRTIINQNLLYNSLDRRLDEPRALNSSDFHDMINSGAAFGRKFQPDDSVLDLIDKQVLGRSPESVLPGGWCLGDPGNETCSTWGDANILRPGPASRRLEKAIVKLLSNGTYRNYQCKFE